MGTCNNCNSFEKEEYFGEAEDIQSRAMGYESFDQHMSSIKKQKEQEPPDQEYPEQLKVVRE